MKNENGDFIVKMIGENEIRHCGPQPDLNNNFLFHIFYDLKTESTFTGRDIRDAISRLSDCRKRFGHDYKYSLGVAA